MVSVDQDGDNLTVHVQVDIGGGTMAAVDFTDVADRVGALGGWFTPAETETGTTAVTAVIPCGS